MSTFHITLSASNSLIQERLSSIPDLEPTTRLTIILLSGFDSMRFLRLFLGSSIVPSAHLALKYSVLTKLGSIIDSPLVVVLPN
jgi:tRNA U34 5-carboxymethylaminomethyl modifying GTPase MnmE/TrmE